MATTECKHPYWIEKGKYEVCRDCGTRFPCQSDCDHMDCLEHKGKRPKDKYADIPRDPWWDESKPRRKDRDEKKMEKYKSWAFDFEDFDV